MMSDEELIPQGDVLRVAVQGKRSTSPSPLARCDMNAASLPASFAAAGSVQQQQQQLQSLYETQQRQLDQQQRQQRAENASLGGGVQPDLEAGDRKPQPQLSSVDRFDTGTLETISRHASAAALLNRSSPMATFPSPPAASRLVAAGAIGDGEADAEGAIAELVPTSTADASSALPHTAQRAPVPEPVPQGEQRKRARPTTGGRGMAGSPMNKVPARGKAPSSKLSSMSGVGFFKGRTDVLDHPHATLPFSELAKLVMGGSGGGSGLANLVTNVRAAKEHERREVLLRVSALL